MGSDRSFFDKPSDFVDSISREALSRKSEKIVRGST